MPRSFVIAATLIAGTLSIAAHAQTQGDPDANTVGGGAALPTLILPDSITRPLTSRPRRRRVMAPRERRAAWRRRKRLRTLPIPLRARSRSTPEAIRPVRANPWKE